MNASSGATKPLISRLALSFRQNQDAWGIPDRWVLPLLVAPLAGIPVLAMGAGLEHPWFYWITVEDGVVEWLQFAALVLGAAAWAAVARQSLRSGNRTVAALTGVVVVAALLVAGEEISWGQRVFGWSTPPELDAINHQGELNLHNIASVEFLTRIGQFGASAYGLFVPLLCLVPRLTRSVNAASLIPPVGLISFFAVPVLYWAVRVTIEPARPMLRFSEVPELSLYIGFALFGWLSVRRLRSLTTRAG